MIRHLLLDLDNTLYPASAAMNDGITKRMLAYVAAFLRLPLADAVALRTKNLPSFGTTLEWLKAKHGLTDENAFFEAVHPESEIDELAKDPNLRPYLLSLGLPMTLLTNAPMSHARRLLHFFDIEDLFLGIFDLTFHNGRGKPYPDCFRATLDAVGYQVDETLFVDDHPKYVRGWKDIGGLAAIVDEGNRYTDLAREEGYLHLASIYELKALLPELVGNS